MLRLRAWGRPLAQVLAGPEIGVADLLTAERIMKPILQWQEWPDLAIPVLSGVVSVPHQRLIIWQCHWGAQENHFVCGRGTAKSSTVAVQYFAYRGTFYPKKKLVELSNTGFRGGQNIHLDMERWMSGLWDDQEAGLEFFTNSVERTVSSRSLIHRAQNYWQIDFKSGSFSKTLPTNDEEKLRGERGHLLELDEANFMAESLIDRVAKNFLNIGGGFATGGVAGEPNQVFYTTTIDYSWRTYQRKADAARADTRRSYEARKALDAGQIAVYRDLQRRGILDATYTCLDYSDTIVREVITTRDGRRMRVRYPNANVLLGHPRLEFQNFPRGRPFTARGDDGRPVLDLPPERALTTFPFDLGMIERDLLNGAIDEVIWLQENKSVVDTATGDVYPHGLMDTVTCKGDRSLIPFSDCDDDYRRVWASDQRDFVPPVMYECTDPCVLGVDVAGGNRDFAAFVVFRIGPAAQGRFNPLTGLGKSPWSNVIWVEQHRQLTQKQVADKIRELRRRYNLVWHHEPWKDDWEWCRAIGLDTRNVGSAVRDALVGLDLTDEQLNGEQRIYDPLDPDERIVAFHKDPKAVPMLDAITAQDTTNEKLVEFTLAQMKVGRLYLPKWLEESQRPDRDPKFDIGYNGARVLDYQLRKLQQEPTARARRFFMPGDTAQATEKKDCWAAFIYGAKQLRAHLIRQQTHDNRPPASGAARVTVNSGAGKRRPMGGRDGL